METAYLRGVPVSPRIRLLQIVLLAVAGMATFVALTTPIGLRTAAPPLSEGSVAPYTLLAPEDIEYISAIRTEEARQAAEFAVSPIYTQPDSAIAREQINRLTTTLQLVTSIRDDTGMGYEDKKTSLGALSDVRLDPATVEYVLSISSTRWVSVEEEALRVLEQVMRRSVHDDDVDTAKQNIPSLVSLTFSEQQVKLIAQLTTPFVVPNSLYSEELTQAARQKARDAVKPVVQSYKQGEMVVPAGAVITPADMEALQQLGMIQTGQRIEDMLGAAMVTILSALFVPLYFLRRKRNRILRDARNLFVVVIVYVVFLIGARAIIPNRVVLPYLYPLPAAGLLLTSLYGLEVGLVFSMLLSILAAYGLPNTLNLTLYYLLMSLFGLLALGPARRFWSFVLAGIAIAGTGCALLLAYYIPFVSTDWIGMIQLAGAAAGNGFLCTGIALLGQYFLSQALGIATALQLLEISRPDFPLLKFFLQQAPGTYQHSLQVANLAEQAAERIGADPLLTRVGALFHDVGKALNAAFFVENQAPGNMDKHHDMPPEEVAGIIIRHVTDGVQLARKHRLPRRLQDFMLEHHGTFITRYQYAKAVEDAGGDESKVDKEKFRYPGPRPASRETALLMLADAVEARARADRPSTDDEARALALSAIDNAQKSGQLDDTLLTLRDLNLIAESFATTIRGAYHPRIQYPKIPAEQDTTPSANPK